MCGADIIECMVEMISNNLTEEALTSLLWYTQTESVKFIETLQGFLPVCSQTGRTETLLSAWNYVLTFSLLGLNMYILMYIKIVNLHFNK